MPRRIWNNDQFNVWLTATGLSVPMAAVVLDVSERTLKRMRSEEIGIKDAVAATAEDFLNQSRTTKGGDAIRIDSLASEAGIADLCAALPYAHVCCLTSSIARGWKPAAIDVIQMSQPIRIPQPLVVGEHRIEWYATEDLPWGVECRTDNEGRPYRIASIERTVIELAAHVNWAGSIDDVIKSFRNAFGAARQTPDVKLLIMKAKARGPELIETVNFYASRLRQKPTWQIS